jgi:hypothetical protein
VGVGIFEGRFKNNRMTNQTSNDPSLFPNISFKEKTKEQIEKEKKDIEKSLR